MSVCFGVYIYIYIYMYIYIYSYEYLHRIKYTFIYKPVKYTDCISAER